MFFKAPVFPRNRGEGCRVVGKGQFHIYQVATVKEGIEILTGVRAGQPNKKGIYPAGTVYGAVQEKLKKYYQRSYKHKKAFGQEE